MRWDLRLLLVFPWVLFINMNFQELDNEQLISATSSLWSKTSHQEKITELTEESKEKHWRPKRGSILLLPGLTEQIEAP